MQHDGAHIGSTVIIKGDISSGEALSIAGRVEGKIDVPGHVLTVDAGGCLLADVTAASIVVFGTVKGALVADGKIDIRTGAEVEGDLTAPILSVQEGAHVLGKVDIVGTRRVLELSRAS